MNIRTASAGFVRGRPWHASDPHALVVAWAATAVGAVYVWVLIAKLASGDDALAGMLVLVPVLSLLTIVMAVIAARQEADPGLRRLLFTAFVVKMVGGAGRYIVAFSLYDGQADASRYHRVGSDLAEAFSSGQWDLGSQGLVGTRFIEVVTGVVYWVTGPSKIAGFLVFAWIGFLGQYWFYRAFRVAVPEGNLRLYAAFVFFLPSLVFWPSSIGKEAWMLATLGLAAYGAACLLGRRRGGLWRLGLGLWGAAMVRPHVAVLLLAGLGIAVVLQAGRRAVGSHSALGPIVRAVGAGAIAVAFVAVLGTASENFEVGQERRAETLTDVRDYANQQSEQGGSAFEAEPVDSPLDFPAGFVSVLFRPFPHEVDSGQALVSALEGMGLLAATGWRFRSVLTFVRRLRRTPYLLASAVFVLGFVWGFSSFGNFGILVRQRVQVYPFLLVALCLPAAQRGVLARGPRSARAASAPDEPVPVRG